MTTAELDLRRSFRGPVHAPGDAAYDERRALAGFALDHRPALVAKAMSALDVRSALAVAREHDLPLTVLSTGHGTRTASDGGLLLRTGRMAGVLVDPDARVARVGAGATWADVLAAAQPFGLAPVTGSHASVGVAGFTLGGGVGWLSRRFGFAADSLVSAEAITADGAWVRADAGTNPDLFWALRGGGAGFAIVTSLEIALHPVRDVVAGTVTLPRAAAGDVLAAYAANERPDALSVTVAVQPGAVVVRAVHAEGDLTATRAALRPLLRAAGTPVIDELRVCRVADASPGGTAPRQFELLEVLPVDALLAAAERADGLEVREWGGAMTAPGSDAGPVGHRDVRWSVTIAGTGAALDPLRGDLHGGSFLNFLHDPARVADAYTPADFARLQELKAEHDPDAVLGAEMPITPRTVRPWHEAGSPTPCITTAASSSPPTPRPVAAASA